VPIVSTPNPDTTLWDVITTKNISAAQCLHEITYENPVLIVDDESSSRIFMRIMVMRCGMHTVCVKDGEQALQVMETITPSLVLSGYMMPIMTGDKLLEAMRHDPRWVATPFILASANARLVNIVHDLNARGYSMSAWLHKPLIFNELRSVLVKCMCDAYLAGQPDVESTLEELQEIGNAMGQASAQSGQQHVQTP
jgi:CheY-like chemotaxis protein